MEGAYIWGGRREGEAYNWEALKWDFTVLNGYTGTGRCWDNPTKLWRATFN